LKTHQEWRDRLLMALIAHKRYITGRLGS